jgi:ATP-binding cassette subfamily F protein 3
LTALEAVREADPSITEQRGRNLLGSLLLSGDDAFKKISQLSGGQRSRVVLARLMLQHANVLILDEPTNHLDIPSQEVLQEVLSEFDGTILFVSHDRYLIGALASDVWAVWDGTICPLSGGWDNYAAWRQEKQEAAGEAPDTEQARQSRQDHKDRRKKTNQQLRLQRKLAELEAAIAALEARLDQINTGLAAR